MIYGYTRIFMDKQDLFNQIAEIKAVDCQKIYREKISGATAARPQLKKLMTVLVHVDVVVISAVDISRAIRPTFW